jgi:hypothetical protein
MSLASKASAYWPRPIDFRSYAAARRGDVFAAFSTASGGLARFHWYRRFTSPGSEKPEPRLVAPCTLAR